MIGLITPEIPEGKLLKLHEENRRWLAEVVFQDTADWRPVILLSRHQWYSACEDEYTRLGSPLQPYLDRVLLWYWGHEHRFAAYGPYGFANAPRVPGRCIGHGGMPVELGDAPKRERHLVCYDHRAHPANAIDGPAIGYCGNALLHFEGPTLTARYDDENGTTLLAERWTVDLLAASAGKSCSTPPSSPWWPAKPSPSWCSNPEG